MLLGFRSESCESVQRGPDHRNVWSAPYHTELSSMEVKVRLYVSQLYFLQIAAAGLVALLLASECSHCTTDALVYSAQQESHSDPDRALVPNTKYINLGYYVTSLMRFRLSSGYGNIN